MSVTPPIAYLSELYKNRKIPLLLGQAALIGSQVLLMEAPSFWVMVIARIAQGISACVIWVVGLALLCVYLLAVFAGLLLSGSLVATQCRRR